MRKGWIEKKKSKQDAMNGNGEGAHVNRKHDSFKYRDEAQFECIFLKIGCCYQTFRYFKIFFAETIIFYCKLRNFSLFTPWVTSSLHFYGPFVRKNGLPNY